MLTVLMENNTATNQNASISSSYTTLLHMGNIAKNIK